MEENRLIVVKQLPIIEERLKNLSEEIDEKVANALALAVSEETVKDVKKVRADLSKEFKELETQRKAVKEKVLAPYQAFEEVYKSYVSDKYKKADSDLKLKIDDVENKQKEEKEIEVKNYYQEYATSKELEWLVTEEYYHLANINVTLSASLKSLKETAKAFVDKVVEDINLINTQENQDEILYEYKKNLNVSNAITTVRERKLALEENKVVEEVKQEENKVAEEMVEKVESLSAPKIEDEEILELNFKVRATRNKLKELKQFLDDGGYDYE